MVAMWSLQIAWYWSLLPTFSWWKMVPSQSMRSWSFDQSSVMIKSWFSWWWRRSWMPVDQDLALKWFKYVKREQCSKRLTRMCTYTCRHPYYRMHLHVFEKYMYTQVSWISWIHDYFFGGFLRDMTASTAGEEFWQVPDTRRGWAGASWGDRL